MYEFPQFSHGDRQEELGSIHTTPFYSEFDPTVHNTSLPETQIQTHESNEEARYTNWTLFIGTNEEQTCEVVCNEKYIVIVKVHFDIYLMSGIVLSSLAEADSSNCLYLLVRSVCLWTVHASNTTLCVNVLCRGLVLAEYEHFGYFDALVCTERLFNKYPHEERSIIACL